MERRSSADSLRNNDDELLARIDRDKRKLYGIAFAYMGNEADALEVIQETVCRVWQKRKTLRDETKFGTWMIRILIHVCMDERKKTKRLLPSDSKFLEKPGATEDWDTRVDLAERVAKLPPRYRMLITLKYYRDMTLTDIAELLEKPEGTVKTWLHKALQLLREDAAQGKERLQGERNMEEGWTRG